jgi:hypothetical protein
LSKVKRSRRGPAMATSMSAISWTGKRCRRRKGLRNLNRYI